MSNDGGAGPPTSSLSAKVSRGNREYGLRPRNITVVFNAGQAPSGYKVESPIKYPILNEALWDAINRFQEVQLTIDGGAVNAQVVGKQSENFR